MKAYCVGCKGAISEMADPQPVTMKNGRGATEGYCPTCGTHVYVIGRPKESEPVHMSGVTKRLRTINLDDIMTQMAALNWCMEVTQVPKDCELDLPALVRVMVTCHEEKGLPIWTAGVGATFAEALAEAVDGTAQHKHEGIKEPQN